jgi:nicotinate-nucleotide adenylyltransferase
LNYAILGGSFDPVHNGHLSMALAVLPLGYDRIILVPAYQSPFKPPEQGETAEVRLQMLLAAISGNRRFTVDACEIRREGVSYTIDTLRDIKERYQFDGKPALIFGDDLAPTFPHWKDSADIAREADIIVASRFSSAQIPYPYQCAFLGNVIMDVSSASVRDMIQDGGDWRPLVPDGVRRIIEDRGLYGSACAGEDGGQAVEPCKAGAAAFNSRGVDAVSYIEDEARGMMNLYRFIHSRNVALHSADLALRFGLDPDRAYLAGITHDICKDFSADKMTEYALRDGRKMTSLERRKPALLHGRAAAMLIQEKFGLSADGDNDIIEAARFHTSGKRNMGALAKIVYIADKIEAARTTVAPRLRRLAFGNEGKPLSLDALFDIVLDATVSWLFERGLAVSEETLKIRREIRHEETN